MEVHPGAGSNAWVGLCGGAAGASTRQVVKAVDGFEEKDWPEPWCSAGEADGLARELAREVGPAHPLFGVPVVAIGRRRDRDDVLFWLPDRGRLAVVHLTWSRRRETDPRWPSTAFFESWEDWLTRGAAREDDE